ncbi:MAG: excinuclease ABC subunit UvrC [Eubacteriales bacterium]
MFAIQEELRKLPKSPGVYLMHDASDRIIYVGKAISLKNRVMSYFRASTTKSQKIQKMVTQIVRFEYIVTDSELEALVLENNLIKEYNPKYNTMLKDDKTYPYIKVTMGEAYPRILFSREMKKDKSKYYGPYTSAFAVKDTITLMNKLFQLRTCNKNLPRDIGKGRTCLNYHMKQCNGPCQNHTTQEEYRLQVEEALSFLGGNYAPVIQMIEKKMVVAAEVLEYEDAAYYRDLLGSVKSIAQKQKITDSDLEDKDIIALATAEDSAAVQAFFIRGGKLIGREHFYMERTEETDEAEILGSFVKQFYAGTPFIPKEIMLQYEIEEATVIEEWLTKKKGNKVSLRVPKKGSKEKLVELAATNAKLVLTQDKERLRREEGRTIGAAKEIAAILGLKSVGRMEAYDISNISGFQTVGSMVVFEKGKPKKSDYRKFKIKSVTGPDDYACMKEVLSRRLIHGLEENESLEAKQVEKEYGSFTKFPDLILMDGGKGQVNIALEVLRELELEIPVCGMVKDEHHNTRGIYYNGVELPISTRSEGFRLITRIQDEAHRFAIEYHRSLRSKTQVHSILDDIEGIGPTRRKVLMKYFTSIQEIREAEVETLESIEGISSSVAENIYQYFHHNSKKS